MVPVHGLVPQSLLLRVFATQNPHSRLTPVFGINALQMLTGLIPPTGPPLALYLPNLFTIEIVRVPGVYIVKQIFPPWPRALGRVFSPSQTLQPAFRLNRHRLSLANRNPPFTPRHSFPQPRYCLPFNPKRNPPPHNHINFYTPS